MSCTYDDFAVCAMIYCWIDAVCCEKKQESSVVVPVLLEKIGEILIGALEDDSFEERGRKKRERYKNWVS